MATKDLIGSSLLQQPSLVPLPRFASSRAGAVQASDVPTMNAATLKKICRDHDLYSTAELNDKLYVHYKGFKKIEGLDEFKGLKVIYLEGNGFTTIEGLSALSQLRCLYLQENMIEKIENLDALTALDTINLNQNLIRGISGLVKLTPLNTLLLNKNRLAALDDLAGVLRCPSLSVIDLSDNKIDDVKIVDLLQQMPKLKVLYLKGNPVTSNIRQYRKTLISRLKNLTYLDERPVFPEDRRRAEAWALGGDEAEKKEIELMRKEKEESDEQYHKNFEKLMADAASQHEAEQKAERERKIAAGEPLDEEKHDGKKDQSADKDDEDDKELSEREHKEKRANDLKDHKGDSTGKIESGEEIPALETPDTKEKTFITQHDADASTSARSLHGSEVAALQDALASAQIDGAASSNGDMMDEID